MRSEQYEWGRNGASMLMDLRYEWASNNAICSSFKVRRSGLKFVVLIGSNKGIMRKMFYYGQMTIKIKVK